MKSRGTRTCILHVVICRKTGQGLRSHLVEHFDSVTALKDQSAVGPIETFTAEISKKKKNISEDTQEMPQ